MSPDPLLLGGWGLGTRLLVCGGVRGQGSTYQCKLVGFSVECVYCFLSDRVGITPCVRKRGKMCISSSTSLCECCVGRREGEEEGEGRKEREEGKDHREGGGKRGRRRGGGRGRREGREGV